MQHSRSEFTHSSHSRLEREGERAGDQRDIKREHLDKLNKVRFRGPSNKSKINLFTFSSLLIHAIVPFLSVIMRRSISNQISDWFILFREQGFETACFISNRTNQKLGLSVHKSSVGCFFFI